MAQQLVADRWHLVAYMRDAIERLLLRQHAKLRAAATSLSEATPTVWFPSVMAMARMLSPENMALLKVSRENHPDSMDALAEAVGKHAPNVSRSLHTMAQYGLVKLTKHVRTVIPQATAERVTVDFFGVAEITSLEQAISAKNVSHFTGEIRSFYLFEGRGSFSRGGSQHPGGDRPDRRG